MTSAAGLIVRDVQGANCLLTLLKRVETKKPSGSCQLSRQQCMLTPASHFHFSGKNQLLAGVTESLENEGPGVPC